MLSSLVETDSLELLISSWVVSELDFEMSELNLLLDEVFTDSSELTVLLLSLVSDVDFVDSDFISKLSDDSRELIDDSFSVLMILLSEGNSPIPRLDGSFPSMVLITDVTDLSPVGLCTFSVVSVFSSPLVKVVFLTTVCDDASVESEDS